MGIVEILERDAHNFHTSPIQFLNWGHSSAAAGAEDTGPSTDRLII